MKISIQIPNSLFEEVRKLAHRERTTFKALVEEGLRRIISDQKQRSGSRLRKATFKGNVVSSLTLRMLHGIEFGNLAIKGEADNCR